MACDTLVALRTSPNVQAVYAMTPDAEDIPTMLGLHVITDAQPGNLNTSLSTAAEIIADREPNHGLAIVLADVPCVRPMDFAAALHAATTTSIISDQRGTGTTMLFDPLGTSIPTHVQPRFGPHSCAAHVLAGARNIASELAKDSRIRLQRDVDTAVDLWDALRIGVGEHTSRWSAEFAPALQRLRD
jgi:2-phospho-L-lactate/phosphoenolpyruvate guanylyltransferase